MPYFFALLIVLFSSRAVYAGREDCRELGGALHALQDSRDPEIRSKAGVCLVRNHIGSAPVARAALRIVRDEGEDLLLREDLINAFADATLRRKVRVEQKLLDEERAPEERDALDRHLGSVGNILAAAEAVKGMDETVPVTQFEADFFRVISDIALNENNHVLLRATAVGALERLSLRVVGSGIYHEKSVRLARETLRTLANREDDASYFTQAGSAYARLAGTGLPGYAREQAGRMISSVNK